MKKRVRFVGKGKKWALAEIGGRRLTPYAFDAVLPFLQGTGVGMIRGYGAFFFEEFGGKRRFRQAFDSVEWMADPRDPATRGRTFVGYKIVHKGLSCVLDQYLRVLVPWGRYRVESQSEGIWEVVDPCGNRGFAGFGRLLVPCRYDRTNPFRGGFASVRDRSGKWGVVDASGKTVVPFVYDWIGWGIQEGLFEAARGGKHGFVDARGVETVPFEFESVSPFMDGTATVRTFDGRSRELARDGTFVDENGAVPAIPPELVSKAHGVSVAAALGRRRIRMHRRFDKLRGAAFASLADMTVGYLVHFAAPCTLSGEDRLPKGTRFVLEEKMLEDAYYCSIDREDEIGRIVEKERRLTDECRPRLKGRFAGVSFFLAEEALMAKGSFRRVRPPKSGKEGGPSDNPESPVPAEPPERIEEK